MASIIIVSDSSLPSWVYVLSIFLRDNKTMCIQIYLPILHYINLFGLSRCTQVTWHTLQHHKCGMSTSFLHSLQCTNLVLFNGSLSLFKYIHQLLNSYSTNTPLFLAWLTGHLCLHHFQHLLPLVGSDVIILRLVVPLPL